MRDRRVLQPRQQFALAQEALPLLGRVHIARHLDRHFLAEAAVVAHAEVDIAHAALAEHAEHAVGAELRRQLRFPGQRRQPRRALVEHDYLGFQPEQRAHLGGERRIAACGEQSLALGRGVQIEGLLDQCADLCVGRSHGSTASRATMQKNARSQIFRQAIDRRRLFRALASAGSGRPVHGHDPEERPTHTRHLPARDPVPGLCRRRQRWSVDA